MNDETLIVTDHLIVSAVVLKQKSNHPWGEDLWSLVGLIPGLSPTSLSQSETAGDVYIWSDLSLQLYPLHCESYYHNLLSPKPQVYLVCNQQESAELLPLLLTVDYDEAASYMETGEQVFNADLSVDLCQWLERFVLTHYQPEQRKKRQRKKWHDDEKK